ncbi:MAG: hypothetical protein ABJG78_21255 [Cyclobacteriaceae bacterium]
MENSKGMRIAATVARYLLGLIFLVFGLNGFLEFLPAPSMGLKAGAFMGALASTGYFFPMVKLLEVVSGIMLLTGKYVPLAIAILGPITLNIFMFHAALEPGGLPIAIVVFGGNILLAVANKDKFKGVFSK